MTGVDRGSRGIVPGASRRRRLWWAALAWLALIVLVVSVPVVLVMVGGSPLAHLGLHQRGGDVLTRRDTDPRVVIHWVARAALLLAWLCWAWLTVCVVLELASRKSGRTTRPLPGSRTMQSVAACLVGTALTLAMAGRGMVAPGVAPAATAVAGPPPGSTSLPTSRVASSFSGLTLLDEMEAGPGSWLDGADGGGGAPDRVPAGVGAGADVGPAVVGAQHAAVARPTQPDAVTPAESIPRPASAHPAPSTGSHPGPVAHTHLVGARETLWSIASAELGSSKRWKEIAELNYGIRQPDGGSLTTEHWISPGWRLRMPSATVAGADPTGHPARRSLLAPLLLDDRLPGSTDIGSGAPGTPSAATPATPSATTTSATSATSASEADRSKVDGGRPEPLPPLMPVGSGIIGAGVVGILDRMRRVQQRHRTIGSFIRMPEGGPADIEQRLRLGDGADVLAAVDHCLRVVAQLPVDPRSERPTVRGVRVSPDTIEVVVPGIGAGPFPPELIGSPGAYAISDDGGSLVVDRSAVEELGPRRPPAFTRRSPAPLLVSVGHGGDELIMVNIESLGALAVTGDPTATDGVVRALALELATSHWAGQFDLVLVGFGAELERFDRVTAESELPDLLNRLSQRRIRARSLLDTAGFRSFAEARSVEGSAVWDPLVVIVGPTLDGADSQELLESAGDPDSGTAVVVATTTGHAGTLTLTAPSTPPGDTSALDLLRAVVEPQRVDQDELGAVTALLDTAGSRESVLSSAQPYVHLRLPEAGANRPETIPAGQVLHVAADPPVVAEGQIEVMVLGPVEVRGAQRAFTRSLAKELVVYLAMHPNGASNEAWATALWPDRRMAPSSLHSTASVARRALGQAADGQDHLPRAHGRLQLSETVTSDWDRFVALSHGDTSSWRAALELVRGRPFDGLRSTDWPILEGIAPAIEAAVVDLAGRLAGASLAAGDPLGAEWAARKGLVVSPYDERLYRMLMRAADLGGNPAGVEAAMTELVTLVAEDIEPLESVHPSTLALYRSLSRGRSRDPRNRLSGLR